MYSAVPRLGEQGICAMKSEQGPDTQTITRPSRQAHLGPVIRDYTYRQGMARQDKARSPGLFLYLYAGCLAREP